MKEINKKESKHKHAQLSIQNIKESEIMINFTWCYFSKLDACRSTGKIANEK